MTAATPGQAAREAFGELGADWYPGTPWHELHQDLRAQWEAGAQAVIDHYRDNRANWPDEGDLAEIATRAVEQEQAAMAVAASQELAAAMAETRAYREALAEVRRACEAVTPGGSYQSFARRVLAIVNRLEGK